MKRAFIAFIVALVIAGVFWWFRYLGWVSLGEEKPQNIRNQDSPNGNSPAQVGTDLAELQPAERAVPDVKELELKKKFPLLTEKEIADALRQGIPLERLERTPVGTTDLKSVTNALEQYKELFGSYPEGDNFKVAKALLGGNPKQIVFLDNYKERFTDAAGALADTWETPLLIERDGNDQVRVRSAGPDRIFGNADDIVLR